MAPPPGQKSNFVDPENRNEVTIIVITISMTLLLIFVGLRIYARLRSSGRLVWDDYACLLATICSISYSAVIFDSLHRKIAVHLWNVPVSALTDTWAQEILFFTVQYAPTIFFTKLSLFLLYLRLFFVNRTTRYLVYVGIISTGLFYTIAMIFPIIACSPYRGESRLDALNSKRCSKNKVLSYVVTVFNVISDLYLLSIPIPVVWRLQMATRTKIGVSAVFTLGVFGCICGVINSYYRVRLQQAQDIMWATVPMLISSVVEINVGIIVGCMPHLTSVFRLHSIKFLRFSPLSHLQSGISRSVSWLKRFKKSSKPSSDYPSLTSDKTEGHDAYLKTEIVGSVNGKGGFMPSLRYPQKVGIETKGSGKQDEEAC